MTTDRKKVLFLCTGNSCRSQMAEGWGRKLLGEKIDFFSAGTQPQGVNPYALKVMEEIGVDLSAGTSKHIDSLADINFDLIVTVCDNSAKSCPNPKGASKVIHIPFDDPPRLAESAKSEEEKVTHYRRVRDEIGEFVGRIESYLR